MFKNYTDTQAALVNSAFVFASAAHAAVGQKRKHTGEDYIAHPARVVLSLMEQARQTQITQEMLAAAWLHDVLEDTQVTPRHMQTVFPEDVVYLVIELTNKDDREHVLPRKVRKLADRNRLAEVSGQAQTIKYADVRDNVMCFLNEDPDFATEVYIPEKILLVEAMDKGCHRMQQELLGMLYAALD